MSRTHNYWPAWGHGRVEKDNLTRRALLRSGFVGVSVAAVVGAGEPSLAEDVGSDSSIKTVTEPA